jgi:hypothetical protein
MSIQETLLTEKVDKLIQENTKLRRQISSLQELLGSQIRQYFEMTNSIIDTKKRFCYENVRDCYGDLVYFYGYVEIIQQAYDYIECYRDIFGTDYPNDTDDGDDDDAVDDTNSDIND